jgi:hypothetical protein
MEKAAYITRLESAGDVGDGYSRLYFGAEFCQLMLPSPREVERAAGLAQDRGLAFSLVTPYVTNSGLKQVASLLESLDEGDEVVVNDWGVMRQVSERGGLVPVLGRLLTRQRRDPKILRVIEHLPKDAASHFRGCGMSNPAVREHLASLGIERIELDNLLQGISGAGGYKASLYYPYGYIATTRLCRVYRCDAEDFERQYSQRRIPVRCDRPCERYVFELEKGNTPVPIYLKGNVELFENRDLPPNFEELGVDRLVNEIDLLGAQPRRSKADGRAGPRRDETDPGER